MFIFKPRLFYVRGDDGSVLQTHQHDVVYYGVVNLIDNNYVMGAVDVWRCRGCDQLFCEDKRYGMTDLAPEVGLPKIEPNTQWAALICTRDKGSNWTLTQVKPGMTIAHSCTPDTKVELTVGPSYDLEAGPASGIGKHRIIVIEKFVNLAVDVQTGQKHTTTTNAYQALGKPFSIADYALSLLLLADIAAGWLARERIKGLIEKQWHPLDMPAYG